MLRFLAFDSLRAAGNCSHLEEICRPFGRGQVRGSWVSTYYKETLRVSRVVSSRNVTNASDP